MSKAPDGFRWMVSPDGYQASLIPEIDARYYTAWADCTEMSNEEVAELMKQRQEAWSNVQLPMAA